MDGDYGQCTDIQPLLDRLEEAGGPAVTGAVSALKKALAVAQPAPTQAPPSLIQAQANDNKARSKVTSITKVICRNNDRLVKLTA